MSAKQMVGNQPLLAYADQLLLRLQVPRSVTPGRLDA